MPNELQQRAFLAKFKRNPALWACYPHPKFPTLSITGNECALSCKHCNRQYLKSMIPCPTPKAFHEKCVWLAKNGARGVLISGGYNAEGWVPLEGFLDSIERTKLETGLFLNVHTGLVPPWLARELGRVGIDMASVDLIGSDETIELVLGVQKTTKDYGRTLKALEEVIPSVVPHICIGLHEGKLLGERKALEIAAGVGITAFVFLVIIPTPGTPFQDISPPEPAAVGELIAGARLMFPKIPLALGCMRPRASNRTEIEIQAIRSGTDRIELPSPDAVRAAGELGLEVRRLNACCAVPTEVAERWSLG